MTGTITIAAATEINRGRLPGMPHQPDRSVCVMFIAADAAVSQRADWRLPRDYTVIDASSVEAAAALVQGHTLDLLILELGLPAEPGLAMVRQVKAHPRLGMAPLILFGAYGDMSTIRRGLELGARDYFITGEAEPWVVARRIPAWLHDAGRRDLSRRPPRSAVVGRAPAVPTPHVGLAELFGISFVGLALLLVKETRFLVVGRAAKLA